MTKVLKAVKPEVVKPGKPKFIISGKAGVGKTFLALDFPSVYYFDTEGGATQPQYRKKLIESGGIYFGKEQGSQDFNSVLEEIQTLATTAHKYKTVVIDSFSKLYNLAASAAEMKVGSDYGKDRKEANKPTRQLLSWIEKLDMNIILICHEKGKWERDGKSVISVGTTFDGYDKMEYDLDLWLEILIQGDKRHIIVRKSRIDSLPTGGVFPCIYKELSDKFGEETLFRAPSVYEVATSEEVSKIKELVELMKTPEGWEDKCFQKAGVVCWEDMGRDMVRKSIEYLSAFKKVS